MALPYELGFYLLVLILLLLGFQKRLRSIFLEWPLAILLSEISKYHLPCLSGYYCYFAAGAVFALIKNNFTLKAATALSLSLILCINFSIVNTPPVVKSEHSSFVVALIMIALFLFFGFLNSKKGSNLNLCGSTLLGALSYPIYLVHAHFGYMFISQFGTEKNKYSVYIITVFLVIMVSYFINLFVEKKSSKLFQKILREKRGLPEGRRKQSLRHRNREGSITTLEYVGGRGVRF